MKGLEVWHQRLGFKTTANGRCKVGHEIRGVDADFDCSIELLTLYWCDRRGEDSQGRMIVAESLNFLLFTARYNNENGQIGPPKEITITITFWFALQFLLWFLSYLTRIVKNVLQLSIIPPQW
jgi:hypothetical protein